MTILKLEGSTLDVRGCLVPVYECSVCKCRSKTKRDLRLNYCFGCRNKLEDEMRGGVKT